MTNFFEHALHPHALDGVNHNNISGRPSFCPNKQNLQGSKWLKSNQHMKYKKENCDFKLFVALRDPPFQLKAKPTAYTYV